MCLLRPEESLRVQNHKNHSKLASQQENGQPARTQTCLDRTGCCTAEAASASEPHHGALYFARTRHGDLHKLARAWVTVIRLTFGTLNFQGFNDLRRSKANNDTLLAEVSKDLPPDKKAVLAVLILAGDIFPSAEALYNCCEWTGHWADEYSRMRDFEQCQNRRQTPSHGGHPL